MEIKQVTKNDIIKWKHLSFEYDNYVKELVSDITEWYEGNENSPSFKFYMESKIKQREAFMAIEDLGNCLGIISFSYKNNNITFFGISHKTDLKIVGNKLLCYAFNLLDKNIPIHVNLMKSSSDWIKQHREIYLNNGFIEKCNSFENGVPVVMFEKNKIMKDKK